MSFNLFTLSASPLWVGCAALSCLLLPAAGCEIQPPDDRIACGADSDCPKGLFCSERADGQRRCSQQRPAADGGGVLDAGLDAGRDASVDSGHDSGPEDAGMPHPQPQDASTHDAAEPARPHDAGQHGGITGMEELPMLLRAALPVCGQTPDPADAYFVSAGVGEDIANCGGPTGPCRSLRKALQRASDDGIRFVFLDNTDVYMEAETLRLPAGVIVVGGFSNVNGRWTRLCDASRGKTRLMSSGTPVIAAEFDGTARLVSMNIETRAANAGETMIGVLARAATTELSLEGVSIVAAAGGAGSPGAAGSTLPALSASCSEGDGADGEQVGAAGADAVSGSFGADAYMPADGGRGSDGSEGHAGVSPAPECVECPVVCDCGSPSPMSCGVRGAPGCGGAAGSGGLGGQGGGSSIALYAWDAHVFVSGGSLQAGAGGNGGVGGAAGGGAVGQAGSAGGPGTPCYVCTPLGDESGNVFCQLTSMLVGPGSQGGMGGRGRDGGPGGAGAPGASYAAYGGGKAQLTIAADTQLKHGEPGTNAAGAVGPVGLRGP